MMKRRTTRVFLVLLAMLLLFGCVACNSGETEALSATVNSLTQERKELQDKLNNLQTELDTLKIELARANEEADSLRIELKQAQSMPTPPPLVVTETKEVTKPVPAEYAFGVDCTVNDASAVVLDGMTQVRCAPVNKEGFVFDHWEVDGKKQDTTAKTLELTVSKTTQIRAVFHERRVVKCINCHIQFLNANGNAHGKNYTEFDFEEDYTNPVTKKKEKGGLISFYITADIPKKSEIDYWLINGVKYQYPKDISKFRVEDLDEATVYEVVFKGQTKKTDNKTYYTVTCRNCTFTYNGKTAASGKVPAGAKITITGTSSSSEAYFDGTPSSVNRHFTSPTSSSSGKYVFTYTYTVNSDVSVSFAGVVN